jgi:hypothetical protein
MQSSLSRDTILALTTNNILLHQNNMKVTAATLSFSVLLFANPFVLVQSRERALKDDEIAGEATIKDGDCKMECEWNARLDKEDGVELFDVECKVSIGDDEFEKDIEFPTGWVQAVVGLSTMPCRSNMFLNVPIP